MVGEPKKHGKKLIFSLSTITDQTAGVSFLQYLSSNELQCGCPLAFLQVPALPRQACVEWHFIAVKESHEITCM